MKYLLFILLTSMCFANAEEFSLGKNLNLDFKAFPCSRDIGELSIEVEDLGDRVKYIVRTNIAGGVNEFYPELGGIGDALTLNLKAINNRGVHNLCICGAKFEYTMDKLDKDFSKVVFVYNYSLIIEKLF